MRARRAIGINYRIPKGVGSGIETTFFFYLRQWEALSRHEYAACKLKREGWTVVR